MKLMAPFWRGPYVSFFAAGVFLLLVAKFLENAGLTFWADLFVNLGASVTAVTVVEFLWKQVGGDPLLQSLASIVETLRHLTTSIGDL